MRACVRTHTRHDMPLVGIVKLGFQGWKELPCQARQQVPFPTEPSHLPFTCSVLK